jgi:hypothetical protein
MTTSEYIEADERYQELYEMAITVMLDKTDFDPTQWLDEADTKEFLELQNKIHGGEK